jgi:hypothetical protein
MAYQRGEGIGDVSFVYSSPAPEVVKRLVTFARNNVMCRVCDKTDDGATTVDIPQLARDLDAKIQQGADLTPAQFEAQRPAVGEFATAKASLHLREALDSTTLKVTVTDPQGGALRKIVTTTGKLNIDTSVEPTVLRPTNGAGTFTVELLAVNPFLQYQTATTTVTVVDP